MKLLAFVFLVLVILEEYHCDPCLEWLFGPPKVNHRSYGPSYIVPLPRYPSYQTPYFTPSGRPFGATYNIPYGRALNGIPHYGTPYHRGPYGPRYGTLYPTPFGTPNGTPYGVPNGSPNRTPNVTPAQTPVETGDDTSQRKQFFVTPNGIQETPALPDDNASSKQLM